MKKIILIIGILLGIWISSNAQQTKVVVLSIQLDNMLNHYENYFYEGSQIRELFREDSIGIVWIGYDGDKSKTAMFNGKSKELGPIVQILDYYIRETLTSPYVQINRRGFDGEWPANSQRYNLEEDIVFEVYNPTDDSSAFIAFITNNGKIEYIDLLPVLN